MVVLIGSGTGSFSAPVAVPVPVVIPFLAQEPFLRSVAAGDTDGDGIADLAVASLTDAGVWRLPGLPAPRVILNYLPPAADFTRTVQNADGSFTRTRKNGTRIEFDTQGRQTAVVDRNDNRTTYGYDGSGQLNAITDPVGQITFLFYVNGRLSATLDPAGRTTRFEHDAFGNLVKIIDPDLSVRRFAYDARHRLIGQVSKRGFPTTYAYNAAGRNIGSTRPDGSTARVAPRDMFGLLDGDDGTEVTPLPPVRAGEVFARITDGNDNPTRFKLNPIGAAIESTDALGRTRFITRDGNNNPTFTILPTDADASGQVVAERTYDERGNLLSRTDAVGTPDESTVTFEYEPIFNQVTRAIDAEGNPSRFEYDANGNPKDIFDAALTRTALAYGDPNCPGQVTSVTAAAGLPEQAITTFAYDSATCNLTDTSDPLGNPTTQAYDAAGNLVRVTDAKLRVSRIVYDAINRVTKTIDPTNNLPDPACGTAGVTCIDYDAAGNAIAVEDANGNLTGFAYEERDRVIRRTDPLGNAETVAYDDNGNLRFATDRKGQVIEFRYDAVDRLEFKVMLPGTAEETPREFRYDLRDNLTFVSDPVSRLTMTYDRLDRLATVATPPSVFQPESLLEYTYDANGNRTAMTGPDGQTDFTYDALNRLTGMTDPANQPAVDAIAFGYDALGRRKATTLPAAAAALDYDVAGQLKLLANTAGLAAVSSYDYLYNKVNSRTEMTQARSAVTVASPLAYIYDDLEQVKTATNPIPGNPAEGFDYDPLGNRISRDGQVFDSIIGDGNRLLEDEQFCYTYDLNGNLRTKTVKLPGDCTTGGTTTFFYDAEDRLVQIVFPVASVAAYRYDGLGRRIEKDANGATTRYVYDQEDILLEYDGANTLTARYTHGPGIDEPLIMARDLNSDGIFAATERFDYHRDGLGSITELTDSTVTVTVAYVYDSFGQILAQAGSLANPYTYTGRELDTESGLYFYRARYYDSIAGRFLAEDTIGFRSGDTNLYRFVYNNTINFVDPFGLTQQQIDVMLELVRTTQPDLRVPDNVTVRDLGNIPFTGDEIDGLFNPITGSVTLDDQFLKDLDCKGQTKLFNTIAHESVHRTKSWSDAILRPITHPDIVADAGRRTQAQSENISEKCKKECGQ